MNRLIDADALKRKAQKASTEAWKMRIKSSVETILNQFIDWIDAQPTIEERKTGKWNFIGDQMFECTECGTCYTQSQFYQMRVRISDTEFPKFCPNCGADMRGEKDG